MLNLSQEDEEMLAGKHGRAKQLAMSIVVKMAEVYGASELMDITEAHLDICHYAGEASLEVPERLAGMGAQFAVPTTLNTTSIDLRHWEQHGVPEDCVRKTKRMEKAFLTMGAVPTWTCAPYQEHLAPRYGQQIAWAESNAINYANSVIGARTNRYGDYLELCAAITGRVPRCGLHLKENRKGQVLIRLVDMAPELLETDVVYPVLGYLVGKLVQDKIPVIEGIPGQVTKDQLKALSAAAASSGAVALFHVVGVTPEADTLEDAFQGEQPGEVVDVHLSDLKSAWMELSTVRQGRVDAIALGCPHYSVTQLRRVAELVKDKQVDPNVQFIVITNRAALRLVEDSDVPRILEKFGASLMADNCIVAGPVVQPRAEVMMTDSGKWAYYAPGVLGLRVAYGSVADCVRSGVTGEICQEEVPWGDR